ncbi:MAG: ATP-binding protein, partial [Candidatus Izemoplasmatales bacterium]|nr:ATP-binding protein [Candidatus Izemoplasmatales bacterium]
MDKSSHVVISKVHSDDQVMKANFTVNAKVEQLLGRHLITNKTVALYELIKNSYDAGARNVYIRFKSFELIVNPVDSKWEKIKKGNKITQTFCSNRLSKIEIQDDGRGMTKEEVIDNWLQLGTAVKEGIDEIEYSITNDVVDYIDSKNKDLNKDYLRRVLNGEKGIGRLGVDILGSELELSTVSSMNQNIINEMHVDWNAFNDHSKMIEDIELELKTKVNQDRMPSGLKLIISHLREQWTLHDYDTVVKNLRKMVVPDVIEDLDFKIHIEIYHSLHSDTPNDRFIVKNDVFSNLATFVDAEVQTNGSLTYKITYKGSVAEEGTGDFLFSSDNERFGRAKFRAYYLDSSDKRKFSLLTGVSTRDYGNIRLYRDAFRVLPYGEPENDWLRIDQKHSQGLFRTLGSRDLLGYVQISRKQ